MIQERGIGDSKECLRNEFEETGESPENPQKSRHFPPHLTPGDTGTSNSIPQKGQTSDLTTSALERQIQHKSEPQTINKCSYNSYLFLNMF